MKQIANRFGSKHGLLNHIKYNVFGRSNCGQAKLPMRTGRVVFVCKGNICRSAIAEWHFKSYSKIACCSIGLDTTTGMPANEKILRLTKRQGLDIANHSTTSIDDFVSRADDLYVLMEPNHEKMLLAKYKNPTYIFLGRYGRKKKRYIHDPFNTNEIYSARCIKYIMQSTENLAKALSP